MYNNYEIFLEKVPTNINPNTSEYSNIWKTFKQRAIDGYWVGKEFMPPQLYHYLNFGTIVDTKGKSREFTRPSFRDIELEKAVIYLVARGVSGFELDTKYTADEEYAEKGEDEQGRKYMTPYKYLWKRMFEGNLGKLLYNNASKNIIDMEGRGCIKEGTKIATPTEKGYTKIENLKKGDLVYTSDYNIVPIEWTHSGEGQMYTIKSTSFDTLTVYKNHIVCLRHIDYLNVEEDKKYLEIRAEDLYQRFINKDKELKNYERYSAVSYLGQVQETKVSFYDAGFLSGVLGNRFEKLYVDSLSLLHKLEEVLSRNNISYNIEKCKFAKSYENKYYVTIISISILKEKLKYCFDSNNVLNEIYFKGSIKQRLKFVSGYLEACGNTINKKNYAIKVSTSERQTFYNVIKMLRTCGKDVYYTTKLSYNVNPYVSFFIYGDLSGVEAKCVKISGILNNKKRVQTNEYNFTILPSSSTKYYGINIQDKKYIIFDDWSVDHNTGKSFFGANIICHNFLYDGATDYDYFYKKLQTKHLLKSDTILAAYEEKYVLELSDKILTHINLLPGGVLHNGIKHPSPLYKSYTGSILKKVGSTMRAERMIKVGNNWETKGSGSRIVTRSFSKDFSVTAGTRPNLVFIDEVGLAANIKELLVNLIGARTTGTKPFSTVWMAGTSGQMFSGATLQARDIFENPEAYDCLSFPCPKTGLSIGFYIPAYMKLNEFRNSQGVIDIEKAKAFKEKELENKKKTTLDEKGILEYRQNEPITWQDMFIQTTDILFPTEKLEHHRLYLKSKLDSDLSISGLCGTLHAYPKKDIYGLDTEGVKFEPDLTNTLKPAPFPITDYKNKPKGCVVIYEQPIDNPTYGDYVIGIDTYDHDQAPSSPSLGACYVYKTLKSTLRGEKTARIIVAEYVGRPKTAEEFYEICRLLAIYYNCVGTTLIENEKMLIFPYFKSKNSLHLFMPTPTLLEAVKQTSKNRKNIGVNITEYTKMTLNNMVRAWMMEELSDNKLRLETLPYTYLLHECEAFHPDGNYDRLDAFRLCIFAEQQLMFEEITTRTEDGNNHINKIQEDIRKYFIN